MRTRDIMKGISALQTAQPSETLADAARKMTEHGVSALPVVDDNRRVVGMISERDLLGRLEQESKARGLKSFQSPLALLTVEISNEDLNGLAQSLSEVGKTRVEEAMTREVVLANEDDSVGALLQRMTERNINHIPVVKDENLTGLVARQDVVSGLANLSRQKPELL